MRIVFRVITDDVLHSINNLYNSLQANEKGVDYMRQLWEKKKADFFHANLHRTVEVLIESCDKENRISRGMSENYLPIVLPNTQIEENTIIKALVRSVGPDLSVFGTVVNGQKFDPAAPGR